jgi:hypothetical protein
MLLRRGRLALVLDLDNTLLASSRFAELDTDTEELLVGGAADVEYSHHRHTHGWRPGSRSPASHGKLMLTLLSMPGLRSPT